MTLAIGTHLRLPMRDYLAVPALSSGILVELEERCPRAAWHKSYLNPKRQAGDTALTDCGSIAHSILLEGDESGCCVIDPNDHPAEKTGNIPDGWTNKSIRTARDAARLAGKIPVIKGDMAQIRSMVDAARAYIDTLQVEQPDVWAAFQPDGGESEVTMIWDEGGVRCKARHDRISSDRRVTINAKFCSSSAEPNAWARMQMVRYGHHIGAAFYRRAVRALCRGVEPAAYFLVVEMEPPHLCSLIGVDPHWLELGNQAVQRSLTTWQQCLARGHWPAYAARAAYPEVPGWLDAQSLERQVDSDELGIPYDVSKLFQKSEART
jgi:hypothetical protein